MYDSINAGDIPADAEMVAGYLPPSRYAWSAADWARFPNAVKVRIAVRATVNDGEVLDVEPGDASATQAVSWVVMRRKAGVDPTVYCSQSMYPSVVSAFSAAGVALPHFWIAHYDGQAALPDGMVAKQYTDNPASGGHYDLSVVADYWPGVDTTPYQPQDDGMTTPITDPNFLQTVARLQAAVAGTATSGWAQAPIKNEPNALGKAVGVTLPQIVSQLMVIQNQLTAISNALAKISPDKLTGTANITVTLNPGA
jgi:hypothetical protein